MSRVVMHDNAWGPYCAAARNLLTQRKLHFDKIDTTGSPNFRREMNERSGQNTVPRLFIDPRVIGGCNQLATLNHSGKLADLPGTAVIELTRGTMDI